MSAEPEKATDPRVQIEDASNGVRVIRLNNPVRRNALTPEMADAIKQAFDDAASDPNIKAVMLRGLEGENKDRAGNPIYLFAGGMDLKEVMELLKQYPAPPPAGIKKRSTSNPQLNAVAQYCGHFAELFDAMASFEKPIVGVAYGPAVGMGATLLALCDQVYATPQATLSYPEKIAGRNAGDGKVLEPIISGPYVLRALDPKIALDHFETGAPFPADDLRKTWIENDATDLAHEVNKLFAVEGPATIKVLRAEKTKRAGEFLSNINTLVAALPDATDSFAGKMRAIFALLVNPVNAHHAPLISASMLAEQICELGIEGMQRMLDAGKAGQNKAPGAWGNRIAPSPETGSDGAGKTAFHR